MNCGCKWCRLLLGLPCKNHELGLLHALPHIWAGYRRLEGPRRWQRYKMEGSWTSESPTLQSLRGLVLSLPYQEALCFGVLSSKLSRSPSVPGTSEADSVVWAGCPELKPVPAFPSWHWSLTLCQGLASWACDLCVVLIRALCLVYSSAVTILEFLIIFLTRDPHLNFCTDLHRLWSCSCL